MSRPVLKAIYPSEVFDKSSTSLEEESENKGSSEDKGVDTLKDNSGSNTVLTPKSPLSSGFTSPTESEESPNISSKLAPPLPAISQENLNLASTEFLPLPVTNNPKTPIEEKEEPLPSPYINRGNSYNMATTMHNDEDHELNNKVGGLSVDDDQYHEEGEGGYGEELPNGHANQDYYASEKAHSVRSGLGGGGQLKAASVRNSRPSSAMGQNDQYAIQTGSRAPSVRNAPGSPHSEYTHQTEERPE